MYLCDLCVKYFLATNSYAENTEIRRDRREESKHNKTLFPYYSGKAALNSLRHFGELVGEGVDDELETIGNAQL